ncbi:hypothetical protein PENTCL1PPCAC_22520, partial [Pristionchus entomophagus]
TTVSTMGRGGGRGGGAQSTSRQVANALGIAQHEMAAFMRQKASELPQRFPAIQRSLLPLEMTTDRMYMADVKAELGARFMESSFNVDEDTERVDIRRYTDKYKIIQKERFVPDMDRVPEELIDKKDLKAAKKGGKKKRKMEEGDEDEIKKKLMRLEENEKSGDEEGEEGSSDEDSEKEEAAAGGAVSEDDMEEDNDYIHAYFDNGEGYNDGSDDNLGDEDY